MLKELHYGHTLRIARYHDLGPVSTFASRLFWLLEDVHRHLEPVAEGTFGSRELWSEDDDAGLSKTGYIRADCGALSYIGPEQEPQRFLQAKGSCE